PPLLSIEQDIYDKPYFIASQGPKQSTMVDFWRMVLEQRVYTIVMLTNVMEKGREKCAHYWPRPSESFINVGSYIVHNHREERRELYSIRYLEVVAGDQKRVVKQYHFTSWPDFGALERVTDLLDFMADIRSTMLANGDHLLVHCSAGVGRTGTFIGLWNLMDESDRDRRAESINIRQTEQFLYLTKCIAAYIEAPHLWSKYQEGTM
ncbi:Receptor-type tyrosine-protein phosphatase H-like, partial [Homarus americanus]